MRRTTLVVAAAIAFDLGVIVSGGHAADDAFHKLSKVNAEGQSIDFFLKLDARLTPQACMEHKGTVATENGVKGCQFQKQEDANSAMQDVSTTR